MARSSRTVSVLIQRVACLALLLLLPSCSLMPRELNLTPIWFHRLDEQGNMLECDFLWPIVHYEQTPEGGHDFRIRPFYRRVTESEDLNVGEHMTKNVQTIEPGGALEEAMALFRTLGVRHLPVVEEDRYVSIVSDRCLRAAYGRGKPDETAISDLMPRTTVRATGYDRFSGIAKAM